MKFVFTFSNVKALSKLVGAEELLWSFCGTFLDLTCKISSN